MVQSLEQYIAEATNAYQPASQAIQNQLNSLSGQLNTANEQINRNYAQQQTQLENQRNQAAEAASMQAAGSGGSFGGAANLANRKYYEQSFVPAQTQLQTNQANELATARQNYENQRTSLNSQLANLQAEANKQALAQYYADLEAERQREAQKAAARASAASQNSVSQYLMEAIKAANQQNQTTNKSNVDFLTWVKNYSGYNDKIKNTLINGLNATAKMSKGLAGNIVSNATAKALQNSAYYKQYLNWRNS